MQRTLSEQCDVCVSSFTQHCGGHWPSIFGAWRAQSTMTCACDVCVCASGEELLRLGLIGGPLSKLLSLFCCSFYLDHVLSIAVLQLRRVL